MNAWRDRFAQEHPCGWRTAVGEPCKMHPTGCETETAERLRTPMSLDAPAEQGPDNEMSPARTAKLESQVKTLRARINARELSDLNQFDAGVQHGRTQERREIAERLDRNANALVGNGTTRDPIVRRVLRTLAEQLRQMDPPAQEEEATG